jgi:hypothetical protein
MSKVPPAARVPPVCKFPLVKAPVVKLTAPRSPVTIPEAPMTAIRVELESEKPEFEPVSVPPALL